MKKAILTIFILSVSVCHIQAQMRFVYKKICAPHADSLVCYDSTLFIYDIDTNYNLQRIIDTLAKIPVGDVLGYYVNDTIHNALIKTGSTAKDNMIVDWTTRSLRLYYKKGSITLYEPKKRLHQFYAVYEYKNGVLKEVWVDCQFPKSTTIKYDRRGQKHGKFFFYTPTGELQRVEKYKHGVLKYSNTYFLMSDLQAKPGTY